MNIRSALTLFAIFFSLTVLPADTSNGTGIFGFGDPQYGCEGQKENKTGHVACILWLLKQSKEQTAAPANVIPGTQPANTPPNTTSSSTTPNPELTDRTYAVAVPGDINQGTCGHSKYYKYFWILKYIPYINKDKEQTEQFKKELLKPLEKEGLAVLEGPGNHDYWDISQAALDLVKDRHDNMYYAKRVGSVVYIYCGVWPDKKIVSWLKNTIAAEQTKDTNVSFVVGCHYPVLGEHYEWLSPQDRDTFLETLRGKNVQVIMTGHDHQTYTGNAKGIPVVCSGGNILPLSLFDATGTYQKTLYYRAHQSADGSYSPEEVSPDQIPTLSMLTRSSTKEEEAACADHKTPINQQY